MVSAMVDHSRLHQAAYWTERAEETRSIAETFNDPQAKRILAKIAESYDKLAEQAARLARKDG